MRTISVLSVAGLLVSCGSSGPEPEVAQAQGQAQGTSAEDFRIKSGDMFDDDSDKMAQKFGHTNPRMDNGAGGQTAGEAMQGGNEYFQGELAKRDFAAKDYKRKSFWGSKEYVGKVYGGETDGSRFQKPSKHGGKDAGEGFLTSSQAGKNYDTGAFGASGAREGRQAGVARKSDSVTDIRRKVFPEPKVTPWKNQHGLSVDDTRGMLGR